MNEDLNDIDLIDRYLSGGLNKTEEKTFLGRYEKDPEFRKETDHYRKIYQGIDQRESDELRKKLDGYFDEYKEEQESDNIHKLDLTHDDKIISIGWRPLTMILSGVAATFLLFGLGYWFYSSHAHSGDFQTAANHISPLNKGDSGLKIPLPHSDGQMSALPTAWWLPDSSIRKAVYPCQLTYTFRADSLSLYGDPLIAPLSLKVFKKNAAYYLAIEDSIYKLTQNSSASLLKHSALKADQNGKETNEKIVLKIASIETSVYANSGFQVMLTREKGVNSYLLSKGRNLSKNHNILAIYADFSAQECKLVQVQRSGSSNWYLIRNEHVFGIDLHSMIAQHLQELSVQQSADARLFYARGPVVLPVFSLQ